jgi:hypothetical protein
MWCHVPLLKDFIPLSHLVLMYCADLIMVVYNFMMHMYTVETDLFIGTIVLEVVVCWGKKMNVCIKSVSDNYCWSAGRSSSVYFRRQINTSDLWSMSWFCSWSMFKPCSFHWTKRHAFSMHWNRSEQTAWQETYITLKCQNAGTDAWHIMHLAETNKELA